MLSSPWLRSLGACASSPPPRQSVVWPAPSTQSLVRQARRVTNQAQLHQEWLRACHSYYFHDTGARCLVVGVYVNDLVITSTNQEDIDRFKAEMNSTFKVSDLGLLHYYLGLEIKQTEEEITICQSAYVAKILEAADLSTCKPSYTPMEPRLKLNKLSFAPTIDVIFCRSIVGSLRW